LIAVVAIVLAALSWSAPPAPAREVIGEVVRVSSGPVTSEASRKMVSRLRGLGADFRAARIDRHNAAVRGASRYSTGTLKVDDAGRVQVAVTVTDTSPATLQMLAGRGLAMQLVNRQLGIVQGWVAVEDLETLAGESAVRKIRPPSYVRPRTGPIDTLGDRVHRCDKARAAGFTGAGVKVGVISIGVANLAQAQAAGELGPVQVLSTGNPTDNEGVAMMEIIHDCAPNAELLFSAANETDLGVIDSMNALLAAGADIIVDDILFPGEPVFEDGPAALANRTVGRSALRVTAAGNDALGHYAGMFVPGIRDGETGGTRHNFGGGDTLLRVTIAGDSTATIVLQWANPFGKATDDYDLCVRQTTGALIDCSTDVQNGNDDPIEALDVNCPPPGDTNCLVDVQITLFSGVARQLSLFCFDACEMTEFNVFAGSIFGHATVPEVITVAATDAEAPSEIEAYSSAGPTSITFPAFQARPKPDVTGVDCVSTSVLDPFCGTSAAAPHVAGVAALVMEAMGSAGTIDTVTNALKATAIDRGPPGYDSDWGFGLVDALAAVQSAFRVSLAAAVLPSSRSVVVGSVATAFVTIVAVGTETATGCTIAPTTRVPAVFHYQSTDPRTNAVTGTPDKPVDIPAGSAATFVISFTATGPLAPTDVQFAFRCANTASALPISGVNTLLLSISSTPVPDVIALVVTPTQDGIANIPGATGIALFAVATSNVGSSGAITVSGNTGGTSLGVLIRVCQTNAAGACLATPAPTVTVQMGAGQTSTFAVFVNGTVPVPFDPAVNRAVVVFKEANGVTRGATSVAIRTQ
jgi:hypothetical protein